MKLSLILKQSKNIFFKENFFWQQLLLLVIAVMIWSVYFPAIMSPDSINQYKQSLLSDFNDWHPPLMSIVLWSVMKLGGGISTVSLLQCLVAIFGLRNIFSLLIIFLSEQKVSKSVSKTAATITTLFFLIPFLTPFMFISVIFWKDAWLAILFLWLTSYLVWLYLNMNELSRSKFILHIFLISMFSASMILIRHNAIVTLPVYCLGITLISCIKLGKSGFFFLIFPLMLTFALNPLVNNIFNVKQVKVGNLVVETDLIIMLRLYPELVPEFPTTALDLTAPKLPPQALVDKIGTENIEAKNEYFQALTTHPFKFISTKIYLFWQILSPKHWFDQKLAYDIIENPYDLKTNEIHSEIRYFLNRLSSETGNEWYFIWISGIHLFWLILNIACLLYYFFKQFKKGSHQLILLLILYLIPFSYYFSHLLAAVAPDYRYMYPATLLMQILIFSTIIKFIFYQLQSKNLKQTS